MQAYVVHFKEPCFFCLKVMEIIKDFLRVCEFDMGIFFCGKEPDLVFISRMECPGVFFPPMLPCKVGAWAVSSLQCSSSGFFLFLFFYLFFNEIITCSSADSCGKREGNRIMLGPILLGIALC